MEAGAIMTDTEHKQWMVRVRDTLRAENDALRSQVAAAGEWEPVPDGDYIIAQGADGRGWKVRVNGALVANIGLPYEIFLDEPYAEVDLPEGWALMRKKGDAQP
jgi:hypothetical protein